MANHKSAIKRHKQSETRRTRNSSMKSTVKTAIKKVREAVTMKKGDEAKTGLKEAASLLDRAVSKGVLHRNNASRKISRLSSLVKSVETK